MNEVAAMSELQEEILTKLKMEPGSGYKFLLDVMEAIDSLPDEQWDELSDEAQEWFNENAARLADNKPILDFDGNPVELVNEEDDQKEEAVASDVEVAKDSDSKENQSSGESQESKRKKRKTKENSGISNGRLVREFFIRKGVETETDIIAKMLHDHGRSMTKSSINMVRYEVKQTLSVLKSMGLIDKSVGGIF